jgi:diguanylate cyclase (GGDEF)-like protein
MIVPGIDVSGASEISDQGRSWFDFNRRDVRDTVTVLVLTSLVFVGTAAFTAGKFVFDMAGDDRLELLSLAVTLMLCCVVAIGFGCRRLQDLRREIMARRTVEAKADSLANYDQLTSLPNRRLLTAKLDELLQQRQDGSRVAILVADLDGFSPLNDRYGQKDGDCVLIEFARRAAALLPPNVVLARIAGDDFAVLMAGFHSFDEPTRLAKALIKAAGAPFVVGNHRHMLGAGIGIAVAPDNGTQRDELMRRAEVALHWAKADGRSSVRWFKAEMDAHVVRRTQIERELRAAASDAIRVHYQPLVDLGDKQIVGFEALARWTDPVLGPIPPTMFIPVAEECGLINELGDQLLRAACRDAVTWPVPVTLAFNISPLQLRDAALGLRILAILGETGLDPRRLEIEVTETAIVENIEVARQTIDQLRQAGVRIALDDFGTGYATLSQLLALHLDKIKIDRSFVDRLGKDKESGIIIRAIIGLATGFGLTTTAEGIEIAEQHAYLRDHGCAEGQGWLFGKAIPASEVPALLKANTGMAAVA